MAQRGCDGKFIRITIALVGSTSTGSGLWLRFSESTKDFFEAGMFTSISPGVALPIVLGILMLIAVILSCSERKCFVQMFCVLVVILVVAEITVGVLVYVYREEIGKSIVEFYKLILKKSENKVVGATLTFIHNMLHCCGVTGIPVVEVAKNTCPEPDGFFENLKMPSCPVLITDFINSKAPLVMGGFIGTGVLLIAALVCLMVCRRRLHQQVSTVC